MWVKLCALVLGYEVGNFTAGIMVGNHAPNWEGPAGAHLRPNIYICTERGKGDADESFRSQYAHAGAASGAL